MPHDESRHPGAAKPQGRQGVQEPLDLLGVPVMWNYHMGIFGANSATGNAAASTRVQRASVSIMLSPSDRDNSPGARVAGAAEGDTAEF